jgi:hypothetical protein
MRVADGMKLGGWLLSARAVPHAPHPASSNPTSSGTDRPRRGSHGARRMHGKRAGVTA